MRRNGGGWLASGFGSQDLSNRVVPAVGPHGAAGAVALPKRRERWEQKHRERIIRLAAAVPLPVIGTLSPTQAGLFSFSERTGLSPHCHGMRPTRCEGLARAGFRQIARR